jgi:hypothetical protein
MSNAGQDAPPVANHAPRAAFDAVTDAPLADAWLKSLDEGAFAPAEPLLDEPLVDGRVDLDALLASDDAAEVAAPDWMLSALTGMSGDELEGGSPVELEN